MGGIEEKLGSMMSAHHFFTWDKDIPSFPNRNNMKISR